MADLRAKKNILYSMLDGPADETAAIKAAEETMKEFVFNLFTSKEKRAYFDHIIRLQGRVRTSTRQERNSLVRKLGLLVPRSGTSGPIQRRVNLSNELKSHGDFYIVSLFSRL